MKKRKTGLIRLMMRGKIVLVIGDRDGATAQVTIDTKEAAVLANELQEYVDSQRRK